MKKYVLFLLLFLAILIEVSKTTIPLVLDIIIILYILERKSWVFAVAVITGLFLDVALVRSLGQSSIFFLGLLFIITLYERKFEITSQFFVLFSSFFASLFFLAVFGYNYILQQALVSSFFSFFLFKVIKHFNG